MKRAEKKIINCSKYWFSEDQKSRTAGERDIINAITSTIVEARKKPKGGER